MVDVEVVRPWELLAATAKLARQLKPTVASLWALTLELNAEDPQVEHVGDVARLCVRRHEVRSWSPEQPELCVLHLIPGAEQEVHRAQVALLADHAPTDRLVLHIEPCGEVHEAHYGGHAVTDRSAVVDIRALGFRSRAPTPGISGDLVRGGWGINHRVSSRA